eukprot:gene32505-5344_t
MRVANVGAVRYGGRCANCRCGPHVIEPDARAVVAALQLAEALDRNERIDFDVPVELADPRFHIDHVWTRGPGRMFGVAVCSRDTSMPIQIHNTDGERCL